MITINNAIIFPSAYCLCRRWPAGSSQRTHFSGHIAIAVMSHKRQGLGRGQWQEGEQDRERGVRNGRTVPWKLECAGHATPMPESESEYENENENEPEQSSML